MTAHVKPERGSAEAQEIFVTLTPHSFRHGAYHATGAIRGVRLPINGNGFTVLDAWCDFTRKARKKCPSAYFQLVSDGNPDPSASDALTEERDAAMRERDEASAAETRAVAALTETESGAEWWQARGECDALTKERDALAARITAAITALTAAVRRTP